MTMLHKKSVIVLTPIFAVSWNIPAHTYQLSWDSNVSWSQFYASGAEILAYWNRVAQKYDVRKHMKLSHRVTEAKWNAGDAKWAVTVEDLVTGNCTIDHGDVLITAIGVLNLWEWPKIPGLSDFEGKLMHSADYDTDFDVQGKNVAVIGAGSSGIQIVPTIQPEVRRLDHYVRGSTWIATPMAAQELEKRGIEGGNFSYLPHEIEGWAQDPESYLRYRKQIENTVQSDYDVVLRDSKTQTMAKEYFRMLMAQRLSKKPKLLDHFLPDFSPLCKRLTPGPGYLEALTEDNVDVVTVPIKRVTTTGILTTDGKHRDVDAIVCATGFNTHFTNRFPIYGTNGSQLFGDQQGAKQRTSNYLSMTVSFMPNMFMFLGPNAGVGHGNLLIMLETMADYVAQAVVKMQEQNIRTIQPSIKAQNGFTEHCDKHFARTVFSENCSSWYKTDGRVTALWPGSSLHAIKAMKHPRWEDFEYTYADEDELGWLGDGSTEADWDPKLDKSYYLTSLESVKNDLRLFVQHQAGQMATARLRRAVKYPSDDEDEPDELDEEHQEKLIADLQATDAQRNELYIILFLTLQLAGALYFAYAVVFRSRNAQQRLLALLSLSSTLCTAYILHYMRIEAPRRKGKTAVYKLDAAKGPVEEYLAYLNAALAAMLLLAAILSWRRGLYEDAVRQALPAIVFGSAMFVRQQVAPLDMEELQKAKYNYKGA
ncbi:hypothetical protein LTR17_000777 [Elasticomyces elasticus]|nr:hypothetical protein LTR17_000777 [Elasticomyces elasticus]